VDLVQTRVLDLDDADPADIEREFTLLADQAIAELASEPGSTYDVTRAADVRYRGQAHHLTLPVPDVVDVDELARRFRARFAEAYGIDVDLPLQIQNLRVRAVRVVDKFTPRPATVRGGDARRALAGERLVLFPGDGGPIETAVYDRTRLEPGDAFAGPAVVVAPESTAVVPPGARAAVDEFAALLITPAPRHDADASGGK
jgi:N-methylhydantoinase A